MWLNNRKHQPRPDVGIEQGARDATCSWRQQPIVYFLKVRVERETVNPTIASCVYLTGMIESWGRGIRKVFDECRKYGVKWVRITHNVLEWVLNAWAVVIVVQIVLLVKG